MSDTNVNDDLLQAFAGLELKIEAYGTVTNPPTNTEPEEEDAR